MAAYETLLAEVTRLPIVDRIQLIDAIWETLPRNSLPPLSEEWITEIQRRSAEFDAGAAATVTWKDVKAEALRRVGITVSDVDR